MKFVNFARKSEALQRFIQENINHNLLPASGFDSSSDTDQIRALIQQIYDALYRQNIHYDLNEYSQSWNDTQQQIIRRADVILVEERRGTCLDLAILFCAICCHFDLLPILILVHGHALAAVSLTHRYRDWENEERYGEQLFPNVWDKLGMLQDKNQLLEILEDGKYLAVECTGFAYSQNLSEGRENGFISFQKAVECGEQQVKQKNLIFALDIPIAYNFWLPRVFKERLKQEAPKTIFNNGRDLLSEIYVPLGLIERKRDAQPRPNDDATKPNSSDFNKPDQKYEIVKQYKHDDFFTQVLENRNSAKSQGKRLLIVGDPGGGKSTLLQKIADWALEKKQGLPIWISLAKFNNDLVKDKDVSDPGWLYRYLSEQWLRNLSQEGKKTPKKWEDKFEEILKSRQIWLLLDGADEMEVSYPLKEVQKQLSKGWANSVRVVMSCRLNLWEQQKDTLTQKFDIYRTLEFNYPEQVHQFINNWFVGQDEYRARELQVKLEEENRERLRNLVKNPLRLALLCRIWQQGLGTLPETKAGFYKLLVESHYNWKNDVNEKFEIQESSERFNNLNTALGNLAKDAINNNEFQFKLREEFIRQYLGNPGETDSLFCWALRLGLLLHIGYPIEGERNLHEKVYAFLHPTFQEYFAATAISDYDFFLPSEHKDKPVKGKPYRIFESQWKEVILLWLGRTDVKDKEKENFIQHLVKFKDGIGKFYYYRAYFLAAAGITEFKDCSSGNKIVKQIIDWKLGDFSHIVEQVTTALQETERTKAIAALVQLLENSKNDDTF